MMHLPNENVFQMYLAMPNDCPVEPDGQKRFVPSGGSEGSNVVLYISEDEGRSFTQVTALHVKHLRRPAKGKVWLESTKGKVTACNVHGGTGGLPSPGARERAETGRGRGEGDERGERDGNGEGPMGKGDGRGGGRWRENLGQEGGKRVCVHLSEGL
jgi:hypothetical protein